MRRQRLGVGAELVPLVLILACLAGSFGLIIAAYRRVNVARTPPPQSPSVVFAPAPSPKPTIATPPQSIEIPEAKPKPAQAVVQGPPPEDPTPRALAQLASAEAEQLLEASKANRKALALEEARQSALVESERWRRRQSLIHSQIDTLETKVRKVETDLDAMAFERDALEKELDARKAAAARAKSRPGQAILPHKGPNGTWRRPIVIECRNGSAVIQPKGEEFGLFELESGFGAVSNPFVRAVAREAIRVQHKAGPDGAAVVPYIFFLVRPDGIRPYYEARGRLEPLGITFGYELADQDWEIELPDLDDTGTWDGSEPIRGTNPTLAGTGNQPGASAEDTDLPNWPGPRGDGKAQGNDPAGSFAFGGGGGNGSSGGGGNFPWSPASGRPSGLGFGSGSAFRGLTGGSDAAGKGGSNRSTSDLPPGIGEGNASAANAPPDGPPADLSPGGASKADGSPRLSGDGSKGAASGGDRPSGPARSRVDASGRISSAAPRLTSRSVDPRAGRSGSDNNIDPDGDAGTLKTSKPSKPGSSPATIELALEGPTADSIAAKPPEGGAGAAKPDEPNPASTFVWPGNRDRADQNRSAGRPTDSTLSLPATNADRLAAAAAASGTPTDDETASPGENGTSSRSANPASGGGDQAAKRMLGQTSPGGQPSSNSASSPPPPPGAMGLGLNAPAMPSPSSPPSTGPPPPSVASLPPLPPLPMNLPIPAHPPTSAELGALVRRQTSPTAPDWSSSGSIVDKTFEVVVVCGPKGVVVQPGNYRVTADALQDRDGLFKKQVVALVKNRRAADPKTQVEPRIRFLVQPQGFETYKTARSQFFVSGLNWPTTTQVADPDPLAISPGGAW